MAEKIMMKELVEDVLMIGMQMSNVCFNLCQQADVPLNAWDASKMKRLVGEWDTARNKLRAAQAAQRDARRKSAKKSKEK